MAWHRTVTILLALVGAVPLQAQQYPVFQEQLPVASINREVLFTESNYGRALLASISEHESQLVQENDSLLGDLEREERELTELRKQIPAPEFATLAKAFDAKANQIRQTQGEKLDALNKQLDAGRFTFYRQAETVIRDLMIERGIVYVLNEQAILMSTGEGNITPDVIQQLDALFASGALQVNDK